MFIDKTGINRTETPNSKKGQSAEEQEDGRSQTWTKLGWRTKEIEQHQSMRSLEIRQQLEQPELDTLSCSEPSPVR